jgi:hypothetical protein
MAMLFLVLFSCLAVGFYHSVATSVQVAKNEAGAARAQLAADSGLQFLRYHLATLDIPPVTPDDAIAAELAADLAAELHESGNLGARTIERVGNVITIPPVALESPSAGDPDTFAGRLEWVPVAPPGKSYLRATVTGHSGPAGSRVDRTVRLDYFVAGKSTTLFDYGIASRGAVTIKNSSSTNVLGTPDLSASILSASGNATSITTGGGTVDGELAVVRSKSQVSLGGGSVGGARGAAVIRDEKIRVVPPPDFPLVDTTPFKALAANPYVSGASYHKNVRIPPNAGARFNGGDVIEGILYVESPTPSPSAATRRFAASSCSRTRTAPRRTCSTSVATSPPAPSPTRRVRRRPGGDEGLGDPGPRGSRGDVRQRRRHGRGHRHGVARVVQRQRRPDAQRGQRRLPRHRTDRDHGQDDPLPAGRVGQPADHRADVQR